ncbi:MAG: SDR family oxidoreductase [Candidatus Latescibacteria bacterium]|nr:SDR family oxidoreductase [Candidatus Latescibacterota bacterium]
MNKGRVAGKAAIVTGAASGAREGASVCVVDVNADGGQRVVDKINADGGEAIFVRTDVGESAQVIEMFEHTEEAFGRVDIVHNNAIWFRHGPATELDEKDWDGTLNIGLKAIFLAAKYGIPIMRKTGGGVIINTGSVHSLVSFATATAYDAAKAGVLGLTRTLAIDYGPDIRVCAVLPGAILTPLWDDLQVPEEERVRYAQMVPAQRLGTGEDIANAVLFLASDEASFITGTALTVDGGMLARTE